MSFVSIEFPLRRRRSPFELIVDPRIIIEVHTLLGYRGRHFLVDTGADLSVNETVLARAGFRPGATSLPHVPLPTHPGQPSLRRGREAGWSIPNGISDLVARGRAALTAAHRLVGGRALQVETRLLARPL